MDVVRCGIGINLEKRGRVMTCHGVEARHNMRPFDLA